MSARCFFVCAAFLLLLANGANAARYQRAKDGKTLVWNSLRGVAQEVAWSGARDSNNYASGEGTLTWYRLGEVVNSYTGKMVRGKFEGPVVREQGATRLQTTFTNGEKVGAWSAPGSVEDSASTSTPTPIPTTKPESPKPTETPTIEEPIAEQLLPTPIPSRSRVSAPSPTSTSTPTPIPTPPATAPPTATATPALTPTQRSTSTPAPTLTPIETAIVTATPTPLRSPPELHSPEPAASPKISPSAPPPGGSGRIDPNLKRQIIAELKKQTDSVLTEVRHATSNFQEIDQLVQVQNLPASVSADVTVVANQAGQCRIALGQETMLFECLDEIETVDGLTVIDEIARDLAAKDTPTARKKLWTFLNRYSGPRNDNQKPLWRYLTSIHSLCNRLKNEAEVHLPQARSFESAGKRTEALREYQEIYRIYPNPITAEKIRQLASKTR